MDNKIISNWIRQARYRAKRANIYSELEIEDVQIIVEHFSSRCAYCGVKAETLDHPFPLKSSAPNVPANVLPSCKKCKQAKKNNDIVWLFSSGFLKRPKYLELLAFMFEQGGGEHIKQYVRLATGMVDD